MLENDMKSLMLWKNDFKNKRDWNAICKALGISTKTVEIELKCMVIVSKENYTKNHNIKIARELWEEFGEVPMNSETEEIERSWKHFLPGTHREDVWHWFEEQFDISVAEDLMGMKKD